MFTACESGRELVSDAGTARRRQTENKAVKPHAVYVELRKQGGGGGEGGWEGEESVSRGSGAVVTSERHAATCVLRFLFWGGGVGGGLFLVRGRRLAATSRALEEDRKQK